MTTEIITIIHASCTTCLQTFHNNTAQFKLAFQAYYGGHVGRVSDSTDNGKLQLSTLPSSPCPLHAQWGVAYLACRWK